MLMPTMGMEYGETNRLTRRIVPSPPAVTMNAVDRSVSSRDILVVHVRDPAAVMQVERVDERPDHFGSVRNLAGLHEAYETSLLSP